MSDDTIYDAIAIGSGHNALVTAAYLARAGWKVLVLEKNDRPGGWVRTEELTLPGFHHDVYSSTIPLWLLSQPHQDLGAELGDRGLQFIQPKIATGVSMLDGRTAAFYVDMEANIAEFERLSPGDGAAWTRLFAEFGEVAPLFARLSSLDLSSPEAEILLQKLLFASDGKSPSAYAREYMRTASRFLQERFRSPVIHAMLGSWMMHLGRGVDDANGAFFLPLVLSTLQMVSTPIVVGGVEMLVKSLVKLITDYGGVILGDRQVDQVIVRDGKAVGVITQNGEYFYASEAIIAGINPDRLYHQLLSESELNPQIRQERGKHDYSYGVMQVHLALSEAPKWSDERLQHSGQVHLTTGLDGISQAVNQAIRGFLPKMPTISIDTPTDRDPSRAPYGKAIVRVQATEVPVYLRGDAAEEISTGNGTWTEDLKNRFADRLINIVGQHLPNVPGAILARHIISPPELAKSNLNAGAGAITSVAKDITEYALWRPSHRTLLPNLYLVGAATWPGHGVSGASGYIVAQQLLRELEKSRIH
jgi:phytoene dehydrogenase-like protein